MSEWQNVIGHDWAVEMMAGGITHGRTGHAYLITGPDHLGKTTLARTFAQALNCESEGERPCGRCRPCMLIAADHHPDVQLLEPEVSGRGKLTLKIDVIRELQRHLNLSAHEARYKIAILKRFDAATIGAANAFLKTLEEPPENVILLLTANDADTLLPTISSRCRTVNLRPLPPSLIEQSLTTRWHVAEDQAHLLAYLADGRIGWAVLAGEDKTILQTRAANLEYLRDALTGSRVSRFRLAEKLARKPENLPQILQTWLSWWRDVNLLVRQHDVSAALTNIDERSLLEETARATDEESALASLKQTDLALWQLERNANTRLVIENLLLTYPYVMREGV